MIVLIIGPQGSRLPVFCRRFSLFWKINGASGSELVVVSLTGFLVGCAAGLALTAQVVAQVVRRATGLALTAQVVRWATRPALTAQVVAQALRWATGPALTAQSYKQSLAHRNLNRFKIKATR